jgi:hypothetical protein
VRKAATAEVAPGCATGGRKGVRVSQPSQGSAQHGAHVTGHSEPSITTRRACYPVRVGTGTPSLAASRPAIGHMAIRLGQCSGMTPGPPGLGCGVPIAPSGVALASSLADNQIDLRPLLPLPAH